MRRFGRGEHGFEHEYGNVDDARRHAGVDLAARR
jgi:hypothetical protein